MLEVYSLNVDVTADSAVPFQNTFQKGHTSELSGTNTIKLNKCGVYMVSIDASAEASTTLQLYKDGIAQPQAQNTDLNPSFVTLVQVPENNSCCPCSSATSLQIINSTATTLNSVNCCVTKIC